MMTTISRYGPSSGYPTQIGPTVTPTGAASQNEKPDRTDSASGPDASGRKIQALERTYGKKEVDLEARYNSEVQDLERTYQQEKSALEKELRQKKQSLKIDIYA